MARRNYYSLRSYISYIATFKWRFVFVFSFFIIAGALLTLVPVLIGQLTASLTTQPLDTDRIYWLTGALAAVSIAHSIFWHSAELLYVKLLLSRAYEYEDMVFRAVINQKYPYFVGKFTGKIGSYVSTLSSEFRQFLSRVCYSYGDLLIKLPALVIIMFSVNTMTGLIFVGSILVMFAAGRLSVGKMNSAEQQAADAKSTMDGRTIDVISNFVSIKAFKKEAAEFYRIRRHREEVKDTAKRSYLWAVTFWSTMSLVVRWLVWPLTILLNVQLFIQGEISIAQLITFLSAIVIFSEYVWTVVFHTSQLTLVLSRMEESYRYLFGEGDIVREFIRSRDEGKLFTDKKPPAYTDVMELHGLSFSYPDQPEERVLDDIRLSIKKNEKVGIVGRSGSGKTTLTKLLLGYYDIPPGVLTVDGESIDATQLVHLVSYVPQDTSLFHRSISGNIAYGADHHVSQEDIVAAAKRAHAHEFIQKTPQQYEAVVGERGIKLSMGQRQRIAIARAFLDNKPLLVLDEATSALDSESEVLVQEALEDLWHEKTVIAIAHRLSTLRNMDRIVVMEDGRIIEQGSHRELLAKKGHYWRLWQHQSDGMIE